MARYDDFLNDDEKQKLEAIDAARERMKARSADYARQKRAIIHAATERRRRAEKSATPALTDRC